MPPRRRAPAGPPALTDADVDELAARLSAGEKPRVEVRAASAAVAAGTRGTVLRIADRSEPEHIVVRLGRDEVPFAPSELTLAGRRSTRPAGGTTVPPSRAAPAAPPPAATAPPSPPAQKRAARSPRPATPPRRAPQPLVVTLRFGDGEWSVESQRGSRRLTRSTSLRPGAVSALAEHVDDDALREALVETVESCRAVVEQRAATLRAELEAAEAALRDYDASPGRRGR